MTKPFDALQYLSGLERTGIIFGLDNIRWILETLGNPHHTLNTVHIAGTNGKGSVASMLASVFKEAGYTTGKYTSPHLVSFNERIAVNEVPIPREALNDLVTETKRCIEQTDSTRSFTYFDFTTALALQYFHTSNVELAFIETGLGGRLDSTNIISPLATIITNIGMDHTDYLGPSIRDIAGEKAGIAKPATPLITGTTGEANVIIKERADTLGIPLYTLNNDFTYTKLSDQRMDYSGLRKGLQNLSIGLQGDHQFANAAMALCSVEVLENAGFPVPEKALRKGLAEVEWPGRLEIVHRDPTVLLDGAHNPDGMVALVEFLEHHYADKKKILIFGVMKDKDYQAMFQSIKELADTVILTRPSMERSLHPGEMKLFHRKTVLTDDVKEALVAAKGMAHKDDCIVVTGSLFTVGEAKALINEIF